VLDKLKKIRDDIEGRVRERKKALRAVAEASGALDPANVSLKQRLAQEQLAARQKELLEARSELRRLSIEASAEKTTEVEIPEGVLDREVEKDPLVQKKVAQEADLEDKLGEVQSGKPKDWEGLTQKTQSELETVRKALEERRKKVKPLLEEQLRKQIASGIRSRKDRHFLTSG
jgi:hypothetical protein